MCLEENQAGSWLAALAPSIPPYIHIHAKELGPFDSMCPARKRRWVETALRQLKGKTDSNYY